jgi:hypothetical protein
MTRRTIGRRHRQRISRRYCIRGVARAVPSRGSVELLDAGASARACARVRGELIGEEACPARRRTHTSRAIHGGRGVGKSRKGSRHRVRTRRSCTARRPYPQQARSKPSARRRGRANAGARAGSTTRLLPGVAAKRRILRAGIRSAASGESDDKKQGGVSHRFGDHSWQQNVYGCWGCTEPTCSPPLGSQEPGV